MIVKMFIQTLISFGIMGALLFLGAGTLHWPAAWVFTIGMTIAGLIGERTGEIAEHADFDDVVWDLSARDGRKTRHLSGEQKAGEQTRAAGMHGAILRNLR